VSRLLYIGIMTLAFSRPVYSFGTLAEFVNAAGTVIHSGSGILETDVIVSPKWRTSDMPLQLKLCTTTDTGFSTVTIHSSVSKTAELLDDIESAQTAWASAGTGTSLSFVATVEEDSSGICNVENGKSIVLFDDFAALGVPPGVIAFAFTTLSVASGVVFMDPLELNVIFFNDALAFSTGACNAISCTTDQSVFSFLGVLVHEMGHLIGVSHVMVNDDNASDGINSTATMFPAISNLDDSIEFEDLAMDDTLSVQNLYPPSPWPGATEGTVSGKIFRSNTLGNRGAHITAFDLTTNRTIASVFSGMSGTRGGTDGNWQITGIPLNTDFAIFVEPPTRTNVHPALSYFRYNIPIQDAIEDAPVQGFSTFNVEGHSDVQVADVRLTGSASSGPGFANADTFRLTSGTPTISDIDFCISQNFLAANDVECSAMSFTSEDPLQLTVTNPISLEAHTSSSISLSAVPVTPPSIPQDWSAAVPNLTPSGTSQTLTLNLNAVNPVPDDGFYDLTATITDPNYSGYSRQALISIEIDNGPTPTPTPTPTATPTPTPTPTATPTPVPFQPTAVSDDTADEGGAGGCFIQADVKPNILLLLMGLILAGLSLFFLRRQSGSKRP